MVLLYRDQGIPQTESSLRKNCKYRASRKRQQEQPTESESGQQSDDSLHSGTVYLTTDTITCHHSAVQEFQLFSEF